MTGVSSQSTKVCIWVFCAINCSFGGQKLRSWNWAIWAMKHFFIFFCQMFYWMSCWCCDDFDTSYLSWIWELTNTFIRRVKWKKRKSVNWGIFQEQNIYFIIRVFLVGPKGPSSIHWVCHWLTYWLTHSLQQKNANLDASILKFKT